MILKKRAIQLFVVVSALDMGLLQVILGSNPSLHSRAICSALLILSSFIMVALIGRDLNERDVK